MRRPASATLSMRLGMGFGWIMALVINTASREKFQTITGVVRWASGKNKEAAYSRARGRIRSRRRWSDEVYDAAANAILSSLTVKSESESMTRGPKRVAIVLLSAIVLSIGYL